MSAGRCSCSYQGKATRVRLWHPWVQRQQLILTATVACKTPGICTPAHRNTHPPPPEAASAVQCCEPSRAARNSLPPAPAPHRAHHKKSARLYLQGRSGYASAGLMQTAKDTPRESRGWASPLLSSGRPRAHRRLPTPTNIPCAERGRQRPAGAAALPCPRSRQRRHAIVSLTTGLRATPQRIGQPHIRLCLAMSRRAGRPDSSGNRQMA